MSLLAFCHIEKCAGTYLLHSLRQTFGLGHVDAIPISADSMLFDGRDLKRLKFLNPVLASISGHTVRVKSNLESVESDVHYITLFRDPEQRYVSDFFHFGHRFLKDPRDFEEWLEVKSRRNFQAKSIVDSGLAKEAICNLSRFSIIGVIEQTERFLNAVATFVNNKYSRSLFRPHQAVNVQRRSQGMNQEIESTREKFAVQIAAANSEDRLLYDHVVAHSLSVQDERLAELPEPTGADPRKRVTINGHPVINLLFRNLVYKPALLRMPFRVHLIPIYQGTPNQPRR